MDKSKLKTKKGNLKELNEQGKLSLFDINLESAVLGGILMEPGVIYNIASDLQSALFFDIRNQLICDIILKRFANNKSFDMISVSIELKPLFIQNGISDDPNYYVVDICNIVTSTALIESHVKLLQQLYLGRKIYSLSNSVQKKLIEPNLDNDVFEITEGFQKELESAFSSIISKSVSTSYDIYGELIKNAEHAINNGGSYGVPSGLIKVDDITNGWQGSDLIILAGRPGMGKTAIGLSLVAYPTIYKKIPCAMFSLEMSSEQLMGRFASIMSGIPASKIIKKQLTASDLTILKNCHQEVKDLPLFIDDTPNITLSDLKVKCRKLVRENGVKMIVVDYLQLMRSGMENKNREQEISEISRGLKSLAKELNVPVIALSQLSRTVESRADKKPMLSDLRESGQIEQDADLVLFCYRPEYYSIDEYILGNTTYNTENLFILMVSKHRNGGLGEVELTFNKDIIRVGNYNSSPFTSLSGISNVDTNTIHVEKNISPRSTFVDNFNVSSLNQSQDDDLLPF